MVAFSCCRIGRMHPHAQVECHSRLHDDAQGQAHIVEDYPRRHGKRNLAFWKHGPESSNTTLVGRSGAMDLAQLRALQDWFLKYELKSRSRTHPGFASIGA